MLLNQGKDEICLQYWLYFGLHLFDNKLFTANLNNLENVLM